MSVKTISIVGSGYSGSSAIYEFLQKTNLFYDPYKNSQLSIAYDPGGLIDLENVFKSQFTVNKSKIAYTNFTKLIDYYCTEKKGLGFGKNLIKHNKNLKKILKNYINNIISLEFKGESTFSNFQKNYLDKLKYKFANKYSSLMNKKNKNNENFYIFCDLEKFYSETRNLIFELVEKENFFKKDIILDQGGTIFNPISSLKFYNKPCSICVLRDPRDIFVEIRNISNKFPSYDIKVFVNWYKQIMKKINENEKIDKNVIFINFEDFILNKNQTIDKIFENLKKKKPSIKTIDFDFCKSQKNIGIYKNFLKNNEENYINNNLKNYLYNF